MEVAPFRFDAAKTDRILEMPERACFLSNKNTGLPILIGTESPVSCLALA
jgi:hypothetical protein